VPATVVYLHDFIEAMAFQDGTMNRIIANKAKLLGRLSVGRFHVDEGADLRSVARKRKCAQRIAAGTPS
jgi:hypothetical protein